MLKYLPLVSFVWVMTFHQVFLYGEAPFLTFSELTKKYHNQCVRIRGFLYQTQKGDWVLAKEPNLKTCCLGSKNTVFEQIFISGEMPTESLKRAVALEGKFYIKPIWSQEGDLISFFHLENAKLMKEKGCLWSLWW